MNKEKLNLTTTLNVGGDIYLQGLSVVRAWYLCHSESTEKHPFPSKTTSIKMYMDEEGAVYLTGDYIKDASGKDLMQFCKRAKQRNIGIAFQSQQEEGVKVVIPKDVGMGGWVEWNHLKEYLGEVGVEVVEARGARSKSLRKRFEPVEEAGINILTDTFTNKDFSTVMQVLNQSERGDMRRYGDEIINVVSDAYNTLKFIKDEEKTREEEMGNHKQAVLIEAIKEQLLLGAEDLVVTVPSKVFNNISANSAVADAYSNYSSGQEPLRKRLGGKSLNRLISVGGLTIVEGNEMSGGVRYTKAWRKRLRV